MDESDLFYVLFFTFYLSSRQTSATLSVMREVTNNCIGSLLLFVLSSSFIAMQEIMTNNPLTLKLKLPQQQAFFFSSNLFLTVS